MIKNEKSLRSPLFISADPGTDDALMLALAAAFCKDKVKALLASYGNVDAERSFHNMTALAALYGFSAEILKTSAVTFNGKEHKTDCFHGEDGLGGVDVPSPAVLPSADHGTERAAELLTEAGKADFLCTGPVTDPAVLLSKHRNAAEHINRLVLMGGGFERFNAPGDSEFNFYADPYALKIVFESDLPLVIAPLDMTEKTALDKNDLADIFGQTPDHAFENSVYGITARILSANHDACIDHGGRGAVLHDALALFYMLCPEAFVTENMTVSCVGSGKNGEYREPNGNICRADDDAGAIPGIKQNVTVLTDVDTQSYKEALKEAFEYLKTLE